MPRRMAETVSLIALAGLLVGCEGSRAVSMASADGGSWAAVLPGARVAELTAERGEPAWIDTRNDERLNIRTFDPILATTEWPERERPSLRRPVFVRIHRQPEGFIYYRTEERYEYRRGW